MGNLKVYNVDIMGWDELGGRKRLRYEETLWEALCESLKIPFCWVSATGCRQALWASVFSPGGVVIAPLFMGVYGDRSYVRGLESCLYTEGVRGCCPSESEKIENKKEKNRKQQQQKSTHKTSFRTKSEFPPDEVYRWTGGRCEIPWPEGRSSVPR